MFDFSKEAEEEAKKIHKFKCDLCRDTGEYFLYNKNIYYTCYACDAKDHKNDIHNDTRHS